VAIHAIGDRAVRHALDAFAAVGPQRANLPLPPRIEHAQLVDPGDLARFAQLGVAASMQPAHCVADIPLVERWWASRRERAYPWRSLLDAGTLLAFGSDAPVEPPDPAFGLYSAVARRAPESSVAWVPGQRIGLDAALSAYTEHPARLADSWPELGTLQPGALADIVVWDADLHGLGEAALAQAQPAWTVVAGSIVYAHAAVSDRG
jgi:hypothetical protein